MPTVSDARFAALRGQGFTGATSDMILQWLQANGATSSAVPDAWKEMLAAQGYASYQRNDDWYAFLGDIGYSGSISDRELGFWVDGGTISPDGVRITQQPVRSSGNEGFNATFTVAATSGNASPLSYQWQELLSGVWTNLSNAGRISGVTTTTLTVSTTVIADSRRRFRCVVTNSYNSIASQPAEILITGAKWFITDQLGNRLIDEPAVDLIVDERSL